MFITNDVESLNCSKSYFLLTNPKLFMKAVYIIFSKNIVLSKSHFSIYGIPVSFLCFVFVSVNLRTVCQKSISPHNKTTVVHNKIESAHVKSTVTVQRAVYITQINEECTLYNDVCTAHYEVCTKYKDVSTSYNEVCT